MTRDSDSSFEVKFSYRGKNCNAEGVTRETTQSQLLALCREALEIDEDVVLRLVAKGKTLAQENQLGDAAADEQPAFPPSIKIPKGGAKIIVMGSKAEGIEKLNAQRSDPLMRGFDDERLARNRVTDLSSAWGKRYGNQHKQYKFCRLEECTDASFGSRPGATTPHAFEARRLLEKLACDPGVQAIMKSRELVVGSLGEMDPIDDRLMKEKEREGGRLLGYNTNMGMRIDIKLRTDDLAGFRPYPELASTLIHEISHNWCADHDQLFWTNFAQMRIEYLWTHAQLMHGAYFVGGRRTASVAEVTDMIVTSNPANGMVARTEEMNTIIKSLVPEIQRDMLQHRLPVQLIMPAMATFSRELIDETKGEIEMEGRRLGSAEEDGNDSSSTMSPRERALAAAEKRARGSKGQGD